VFESDFPTTGEKVIIASLFVKQTDKDLFDEDVAEMVTLCRTAGATVMEVITQKSGRPNASTYFGKGKIEEIKNRMTELDCQSLIIDAELKPSQIQNIEEVLTAKVIDRSQLILDIFSLHAKTNEAKIQVELAQLEVLYPRLTKMWEHLSRQDGGIGTRGPGETQLETDRRLVQKKLSFLKKKLIKIEKQRVNQKKSRNDTFKCALVGYTNVGKSTLLNAMSGADVLVEDKLFATLDTATKITYIPGAGKVVVSDTVGFLRKLPHDLVASFKSTLEVVLEADLLLIIMDSSSKWYSQQMDTVEGVLKELGGENKEKLIIFNKSDLQDNPLIFKEIEEKFPDAHFTSAFDANEVSDLKQKISETIVNIKREEKHRDIVASGIKTVIEVG
jgi:GTP-binding protein HflX